MRLRGIAFLTLLIVLVPLRGQKNSELKEIWMEAESHYLYGEYELANPLYLMLNELIPATTTSNTRSATVTSTSSMRSQKPFRFSKRL
ncbi:MAG: hypothetical protein R2758_09415 [Bacteroidales bacterium]